MWNYLPRKELAPVFVNIDDDRLTYKVGPSGKTAATTFDKLIQLLAKRG